MSDDLYYPALDPVTIKNLNVLRQLAHEHPSYWLTSPYPNDVEKLVKSWFDPKTLKDLVTQGKIADDRERESHLSPDEDRYEYLYQETKSLYTEMKNAKYAGSNEDSMAYYKTAVTLQEKLIGLQERALGLKQVSDFYNTVMNIMENTLTENQRNDVMAQLKLLVGQK